jgi:uncharacterized protein YndB with AHSA1/START domain
MSDKARGYAHRVDIAAGAPQVWRALTESEQLRLWCSPDAEIRARAGGLFRASVDRVTEFEAHIDVCEPQRRLKLIYLPTPGVPPADRAMSDDFILEAVAEGTIVRLLGSGFPVSDAWETQFLRLRTGWSQALARLKVLVEQQLKQGVDS